MSTPTPATVPPAPWADGVQPEPDEVARWMKGMRFDELVALVARQQRAWAVDERCLMENHPGRIESLQAEVLWLREQVQAPRVVHLPDNLDVDELKRRFLEQAEWPGKVVLLSESRPRPVPFLIVPTEGSCGAEPPCEWREGALREVYPEAAGVSQCAREPHGPDVDHAGIVWVPGGPDSTFRPRPVIFP